MRVLVGHVLSIFAGVVLVDQSMVAHAFVLPGGLTGPDFSDEIGFRRHDTFALQAFSPQQDSGEAAKSRRDVLAKVLLGSSGLMVGAFQPSSVLADDSPNASDLFQREGKGYAYTFRPPPGFSIGKKPVQTHLDEVNFSMEGVRGYQYGITVDPVRIKSLKEFGTPEEVAARVVTAEVNRDGVFEVLLYKDPVEDPTTGAYAIDYVSDGKRGKKHFVTRIFIQNEKLYVLTAQVKDEEYKEREGEMMESVNTFVPIKS